MRLFEIINTPINSDRSLSYDVKHNRLKWKRQPSLELDHDNGRVISVPANPPKLTLRMLNKIKHLKRLHDAEQERLKKFRGLMYGGTERAREHRDEQSRKELMDLHAEIQADIQASELEQSRKEHLTQLAMRYVKR